MLPTVSTRHCRVPTINHGRETALPCPLYHFGVTGIDLTGYWLLERTTNKKHRTSKQ